MNIDHTFNEEFWGVLPWMFMNILDLVPEGGKLEISGYPGGGIDITEWTFPIDKKLGHVTSEKTYTSPMTGETRHCHYDRYVRGYTDEWMDQLEQWINSHFDLGSLDIEQDQIWLFHFIREDNTIQFYDQVI